MLSTPQGKAATQKLFPKRVRVPSGWHDPVLSVLGIELAEAALRMNVGNIEAQRTAAQTSLAAEAFIREGSHIYFVERDCLSALLRTSVPDDLKLSDLNWPHGGFMLAFPKGMQLGDCWGQEEATHAIVANYNDHLCIHVNLLSSESYALSSPIASFSLSELFSRPVILHDACLSDDSAKAGVVVDDTEALRSITIVCLSALMLMNAVPEEIEYGGNEKRVKKGKSDSRPWIDPNYLGRTFATNRKKRVGESPTRSGSPAHSKSEHWRRGHWRKQPIGAQGSGQTKLLWIRPTRINGARL